MIDQVFNLFHDSAVERSFKNFIIRTSNYFNRFGLTQNWDDNRAHEETEVWGKNAMNYIVILFYYSDNEYSSLWRRCIARCWYSARANDAEIFHLSQHRYRDIYSGLPSECQHRLLQWVLAYWDIRSYSSASTLEYSLLFITVSS